jgi:hypothetical protein
MPEASRRAAGLGIGPVAILGCQPGLPFSPPAHRHRLP